jgi:hypothetical protein
MCRMCTELTEVESLSVTLQDSNEVIICHGNGDGTFSYTGTRKSTPGDPLTVTALDFNHDGIQ